jgi:putative spermidine/putrescine transport system permease protein
LITRGITLLAAIFSVLPGLVVLIASFTAGRSLAFPPEGLSLRWYVEFFARPDFVPAIVNSLILAALASVVAVLIALPAAFAVHRYRFAGARVIESILLSPLSVPHLVLGLSLLQLYSHLGFHANIATLLSGHLLIVVPFALRLLVASLAGLDRDIERAAASLGADRRVVLFTVILPQIRLGLLGALVAGFILSFDEVSMTTFLVRPGFTTMPVLLLSMAENNPSPLMHVASVFLLLASWIAIFAIDRAVGIENAIMPGRRRT